MKNNFCPLISIIIPIRNDVYFIDDLLSKVLSQTYPKAKTEILIVDGMSTDGTRKKTSDILNKFQMTNYFGVKFLDNPKGQRTTALNIGIKNAKGNIIVRLDARTVIPKDYIWKCIQTLIETNSDNVGGMQKPISNTLKQEAIGLALSHPFGVGNAQFRIGKKSGYVDTVYLGCFRKEIFDKVGLFDEKSAVISEDSDLNQRIRNAGGKVYFNKDVIAYYYPRDNYPDLWKLYFRYGGAKAGNLLKNKKLTAWRQFVPSSFLLGILFLLALSFVNKMFLFALLFILGIYLLTDLIVSMFLSIMNKKMILFPCLYIIFPILHFSWAMGFWWRLIKHPKYGEYWGN